jgi:hypothetical protein
MSERTFQFRLHSSHPAPDRSTENLVVEFLSDSGAWEPQQLSLTMPALPTAVVPPAATSVPRAGRAEFEHDDGTEVPCVVEDDECAAQPASAGEEIWERHAWNSMDGSWRYI